MIFTDTPAVTGAFIMEGIRDLDRLEGISYNDLLDVWSCGCVELVLYATAYVPFMHEMGQKGLTIRSEFPGVWEYEVPAPFGAWFGKRVYENPEKGLPSDEECKVKIRELTAGYFGITEEQLK